MISPLSQFKWWEYFGNSLVSWVWPSTYGMKCCIVRPNTKILVRSTSYTWILLSILHFIAKSEAAERWSLYVNTRIPKAEVLRTHFNDQDILNLNHKYPSLACCPGLFFSTTIHQILIQHYFKPNFNPQDIRLSTNQTIKMQFTTVFMSAVAIFGSVAFAVPSENIQARSSCQVGDIWGAGDAACSASVSFLCLYKQIIYFQGLINILVHWPGWGLPRRPLQRWQVSNLCFWGYGRHAWFTNSSV